MVTRISGLASGMDIDQLVKDLMKAKRAPLDKLTQQKTTLEWQREQYRDINAKLVDFRNNKLFSYGLEGTINAKSISIAGNATAVSVKANANAVAGNMSIEVTKLATGATLKSVPGSGIGTVDMNAKLKDIGGGFNYTAVGGKITIQTGSSSIILDENTDTLATMVSKLNNSKDANVNVFLDSQTGEMSIASKTTGVASAINVTSDILNNFGMTGSAGADAELKINGITTTRSSNKFVENGLDITLNSVSAGSATQLTIASNTDKIMDTVKSFVKDYNEILDLVNKKLGEEKFRKFTPLSSEQKKEMSEDEVKLWESKAQSGLLRNDSTFTSMISSFRLAAITDVNVNGTNVNLTSLGINTGDYTQRGKLVIDEAKLREAIEANPDQVIGFFTKKTTEGTVPTSASATNANNGLFSRIANITLTSVQELATKAGTSRVSTANDVAFNANSRMGEQLRLLDIRMSDMNRRLTLAEDQFYKKFTAMETAMNRYNAQSTSLFQQ